MMTMTTTGEPGPVVFIGDSLIEWGQWGAVFPDADIVNHGQCGDTAAGVLARAGQALALRPSMIFVMVGANDLASGISPPRLLHDYDRLLAALREGAPDATIYVFSILPSRHGAWGLQLSSVRRVNDELPEVALRHGALYLDIHNEFTDDEGQMRDELTDDGVHLSAAGYRLWERLVAEYLPGP
jgi:lysophospholipase L1-like esterase